MAGRKVLEAAAKRERERENREIKSAAEAGRGYCRGDHRRDRDRGISLILCHARTRTYIVQYTFMVRGATSEAIAKATGVGRCDCGRNEGALRGPLRGQVPRWVETDFNTFLNLLSSLFPSCIRHPDIFIVDGFCVYSVRCVQYNI